MAEALYRKYRPQIFEDVVGQEPIERTLKNAIAQDKVSHAYLFTGPRGTGKTTTARLLAKALLCEQGPTDEPDGTCEDCLMIADGVHPDVYELDAASRTGVDNVREEIISRVHFAPTRGRYKIYIIDEVHMLSTAAFNALLKTLEEPPEHVVFILATTDPQKVPETIHSRCQRFDFHSIPTADIISRLSAICSEEDVEYEPEALEVVAHKAQGGMRNALTGLEQLIAFSEGKVTLSLAESMFGGITAQDLSSIVGALGKRDAAECFRWVAEYANSGADLATLATELAARIRNLYVMKIGGAEVALDVGQRQREQMSEEVQLFSVDRLARLLGVLGELIIELKTSTNARLSLEIALTRMVRPESDLTLEALAERVANLEQGTRVMGAAMPSGGDVASGPISVGAPLAPLANASMGAASASVASQRAPIHDRRIEFDTPSSKGDTFKSSQPTPAATAASSGMPSYGAPVQAASVPSVPTAPAYSAPAPASHGVPSAKVATPASAPAMSSLNPAVIPAGYNLENPAALQRIWQSACSILRQSQSPSSVFFLNTKVIFDTATQAIVIQFPAQNDFVFKQAQKPEVQQSVAAALQQAYGQPVQFRFEKMQGAAEVPTQTAPAPAVPPVPLQTPAAPPAPASVVSTPQYPPFGTPQGQGAVPGGHPGSGVFSGTAPSGTVPVAAPVPSQAAVIPPASQTPVAQPNTLPVAPAPTKAAPTSPADVPPWDEVPYGEEDFYPYEGADTSGPSFDELPSQAPAAQASAPVSEVPTAPPVPPATSVVSAQPPVGTSAPVDGGGGSATLNEVQSILAAGFGDGIVVESIDDNA